MEGVLSDADLLFFLGVLVGEDGITGEEDGLAAAECAVRDERGVERGVEGPVEILLFPELDCCNDVEFGVLWRDALLRMESGVVIWLRSSCETPSEPLMLCRMTSVAVCILSATDAICLLNASHWIWNSRCVSFRRCVSARLLERSANEESDGERVGRRGSELGVLSVLL